MKIFHYMASRPWPFAIVIPCILAVFVGVGWTRDDIIEEEVNAIWVPTRSSFKKDRDYAEDMGKGETNVTPFLAMAKSRDGGNLFTARRLEEIRMRMEKVEATTLKFKGNTYTWDDMCLSNNVGLGTMYKFPCIRLSAMDLFQEAEWFFTEEFRVTYHNDVLKKRLVKPRIPRFGIMRQVCSSAGGDLSQSNACDRVIALRTNMTFAREQGLPPEYANPLLLLDDVGSLEMNDRCKICVEQAFEATMENLTTAATGMFQVLFAELSRLEASGNDVKNLDLQEFMQQIGAIASSIDRTTVEEWYTYYVVRGLYAELGAASYISNYELFMATDGVPMLCSIGLGNATLCAPTVSPEEAKQRLLNHADNTFSSVTTAGAPFPFWSEGNGTGNLFAGTHPVGGSGVSMSGNLLSTTAYLDLAHFNTPEWRPLYEGDFIDPFGSTWNTVVETDPLYRWFIAGVTPMTSHCGNGNLTGTSIDEGGPIDQGTGLALALSSQRWCTKYDIPFEVDGDATQLHFAKIWYDLLIDSDGFLGITQGENTPYNWTTGNGCGYSLGGMRDRYTNKSDASILYNASRVLYNVDEGASAGALDRHFLMGGTTPDIDVYSFDNPLQKVTVIQSLYVTAGRLILPEKLKNCNRPGGPIEIDSEESKELVELWKEEFEKVWTAGWDDPDDGEVQFVGFFDDQGGTIGTTGRLLRDITLDNGKLTAIAIILIGAFSAVFLFSFDVVDSKVLIVIIGVCLVVLSFFSALGLGILCGIKVNVNIAWTLPFIILGLGVDDMYIVLLALKRRRSYTEEHFLDAMKDVVVPVTMTSLVNAAMFAAMNFVDVPAVYLTAQMALIAVIFLYFTIVLCYPAYCYLDMRRQAAGRYDVVFCFKKPIENDESIHHPIHVSWMYTKIYEPLVLGQGGLTKIIRLLVALGTAALFAVGVYGITERRVGLGLQDFFPASHQAHVWATETTKTLASWVVQMHWGEEDYGDPDTQLFLMRQFEKVVETPHIAESDTKLMWLASFNVWMSRHCTANFDRDTANVMECGRDQVFPKDNSTCTGFWAANKYNGRLKNFGDGETCVVFEGGVCRPTSEMHPLDLLELGIDPTNPGDALASSWCPVFQGFSDDKLQFCLMRWSNFTGGGGNFISDNESRTPNLECEGEFYSDAQVETPLRYSSSPNLFSYNLLEHEDYLDMIKETRTVCDDDDRVRCWMSGIPFNYWEQYLYIERVLVEASAIAIGVGFVVSFVFLFARLKQQATHATKKVIVGSLLGAGLIALTCILSLVPVVGISVLLDVNMTAFSAMSFLLSVGFSIEYSVHVVHRYINAPMACETPAERVSFAMSFLTLPTFMSFASSTIGVACLAFTEFDFNVRFFFIPLMTVMLVSYFVGCWSLPVLLTMLNVDSLKCGPVNAPGAKGPALQEGPLQEGPPADMDPFSNTHAAEHDEQGKFSNSDSDGSEVDA